MGDVRPIPLTDDDDDFFSDLGGDELYSRTPAIGTGSRLVIGDGILSDNSIEQQAVERNTRQNPFGNTDNSFEVRSRKNGDRHSGSNNNRTNSVISGSGGAASNGYVVGTHQQEATGGLVQMQMSSNSRHGNGRTQISHFPMDNSQQQRQPASNNYNNHGQLNDNKSSEQENGNNEHLADPTLGSSQTQGISSHCHVPHEHESGFTVRNQLIVISVVTTLFGAGEVVGAILSKSIAIGTDVMHLGSDLLSFLISLTAVYLAKKHPTARFPWGLYRAEVLGALLSVFIIWVVTGVLVYLAAQRIYTNTYSDIDPDKMLFTSIAGVVFNIIMALVLNVDIFKCKVSHGHSHSGGGHGHSHGQSRSLPLSRRKRGDREMLASSMEEDEAVDETARTSSSGSKAKEKNIVIRAAFVHVIGDLIQSVGVLVAALIIKFKGQEENSLYRLADPICTFTFSVLVLITTITVIRDAFFILMEGSPRRIQYDQIYHSLMQLDEVKSVHSLKVWSLTSNEVNVSVHLAVDPALPFPFDLVSKANQILREGDLITRSTVQIEAYDEMASRRCKDCLHPGPSRASLVI